MSFYYVKTTPKITKQWRIENYWIELNFSIDDLWIDFEWYLAKPKDMWQLAMLDSFNELMRDECYTFIEKNDLKLYDWEKLVDVTWPALYWSIMNIIIDALKKIDERWDSMFILKCSDTQLRKAKKNREDKMKELESENKKIAQLDIEIAKAKAIAEVKSSMWVQQVVTPVVTPVVQNKQVKKDISDFNFSQIWL